MYKEVIEEVWKEKFGKQKDDKKLYNTQVNEIEEKLSYPRDLLLSKQIELNDFQKMKVEYTARLEWLKANSGSFENTEEINFKNLINKGLSVLLTLDQIYENGNSKRKQIVISSVFSGKLHLDRRLLRTTEINGIIGCIYQINSILKSKITIAKIENEGFNKGDEINLLRTNFESNDVVHKGLKAKKNGQNSIKSVLSKEVIRIGFEPMTLSLEG